MFWDFADRMYCFCNQTGTAEPSQYAQYCYDASGQRVMKVVRTGGGAYKVSIYIGSIFEEYYEYTSVGGTFLGYQNEIMVMDNQSKIASNLIGTSYSDPYMGVKYIYPDHLGSSNVSCSGAGAFLTREEYYPYGETSFGSYGKKRYRFCGKEKDEESGMYYYGARYYLSWTCRFVSVDPKSQAYPWSSYVYAGNNPIVLDDVNGEGPGDPKGAARLGSNETATLHNVQSGDTYGKLSKEFGVSIENLRLWNGYIDNKIPVGTDLIVSKPSLTIAGKIELADQIANKVFDPNQNNLDYKDKLDAESRLAALKQSAKWAGTTIGEFSDLYTELYQLSHAIQIDLQYTSIIHTSEYQKYIQPVKNGKTSEDKALAILNRSETIRQEVGKLSILAQGLLMVAGIMMTVSKPSLLTRRFNFSIPGAGAKLTGDITSSKIGGLIIGWGEGQAGAAETKLITQNLTREEVRLWIKRGLTREWVEKQLSTYTNAANNTVKLEKNDNVLVRKALMEKIIKFWPK